MAIDVITLLTWSRMAINRQAVVMSELMPGGLDDLDQYSQEETRDAIKRFKTMPRAVDRFSLSAEEDRAIISLGERSSKTQSTSGIWGRNYACYFHC
jgi:hypothetical protein